MSETALQALAELISASEDRLMALVLEHAHRHGYTAFTSTLQESWRASVCGLSEPLLHCLRMGRPLPPLSAEPDPFSEHFSSFARKEAKLHRERGIDSRLFLGLLTYYHQSYRDLVLESILVGDDQDAALEYLRLFFDHLSVTISSEWVALDDEIRLAELQQRNRQLAVEKTEYLSLFQSHQVASLLVNPDGLVARANQAAAELISAYEPLSHAYSEDLDPLPLPADIEREVISFIASDDIDRTWEQVGTFDRQERLVQVACRRLEDVSRRQSGVSVSIASLGEVEQIKEVLHRALDAAANGILVTDTRGRIRFVNDGFEAMTGWRRDEVLGRNPRILKSDRNPAALYESLWKTIGDGRVWTGELINRRKNGGEYWERLTITPVRDHSDQVAYFIAIKEDISEQVDIKEQQQQAAQEVARAHQENSLLLEVMPTILISINRDGIVAGWNGTAHRCFGYDAAATVGLSLEQLPVPWDHVRIQEARLAAARNGQASIDELPFRRPDGSGGIASFTITSYSGDGDDPATARGQIWVGRDVTDQAAKDAADLHAQKMESIGQLSSGIAHELNTPIQFIGDNLRFLAEANADLLKLTAHAERFARDLAESDGPVSQQAEEFLSVFAQLDIEFIRDEAGPAASQALDGATRVARIVMAMKEFAHPDSNDRSMVNCNQLIESTCLVARNEHKYCADLHLELASDLPSINANRGSLGQVILNILVNAAHAISSYQEQSGNEERGAIVIRTWAEETRVCIAIADSGTGIPAAIRDRVFDPFFTTKEVGKGTGQGLALAHRIIVDDHGGDIGIADQEPHGTIFTIHLPLDQRGV